MVALLLVGLAAQAQSEVGTWSVTPKLGVSVSNMPGEDIYLTGSNDVLLNRKSIGGFMGGLGVSYQFADRMALNLEALYTEQGCKFKDALVTDYETGVGGWGEGWSSASEKLSYLNVPLTLSYYVADGLALNVGVQAGFLLKANRKYTTQGITIDANGEYTYGELTDHDDDVKAISKSVDFAIPVGLSYEYEHVVLDARYNIPVTKCNESGAKNSVLMFSVGYRFGL